MNKKHLLALAFVVVVAGVVVAVAAGYTPLFASDDQQGSLIGELHANHLGTKLADFPAQAGRPTAGFYVATLADGSVCISTQSSDGTSSGGCNPATDPLGGKPFEAILASAGGTPAAPGEERIFGLADSSVASIKVELANGALRPIPFLAHDQVLGKYQAFAFRVPPADLARAKAVAIVAYDASGGELARQPTP